MRHEQFYFGNSVPIDADFIDITECTCALCRPHSNLLALVSRDGLSVDAPQGQARTFNQQRLTHSFTHVADTGANHIQPFGTWRRARPA